MKKNESKVKVKRYKWGRYLHRLFKVFEDVSRDCPHVLLCFTHRVQQSLCHCNDGKHLLVSFKLRIPPKNKRKEWSKLYALLIKFPDRNETIHYEKEVPINTLTKDEKLLLSIGINKEKCAHSKVEYP